MKPTILITGASQGIGAAIAKVFAQEVRGARLVLVARNQSKLAAVTRACAKAGVVAECFPCDVADEVSVAAMAQAVKKRFGTVDVLINNAGAFTTAPFVKTGIAEFDRMIAVNLRSAFLVTQAFLPAMLRRKSGDIFFMSSIAGLGAYPNAAAYCAAKFGVTGLAKVLRAETKDKGVRVCCVHPGATWSPSWEGSGVKAERIMPAGDIARAILEVYQLSRRTVVEEIVLRPQLGDV
ncbi:MAG: SDR family oxidoreductase [Opitutaceae bacterium]|nr:SDR family oxidoreductase [Opitutaceae bacterium]MBP9912217.1 SDR family oxidoreductase [Opitutaceae bacterium]